MNNCADFSELLSAYIDDELTESDRRRVEEHLDTCESCSALLVLYREISLAVVESEVPAPEALHKNVMDKILSDDSTAPDTIFKDTASKGAPSPVANSADGRKRTRLILLRYVPMAACLAVMLLALPWIINNFSRKASNDAAPMSASLYDINESAVMNQKAEKWDEDQVMPNDKDKATGYTTSNDSLPAPLAPPPPSESVEIESDSSTRDYGDNGGASGESDGMGMDQTFTMEAPQDAPEPEVAPYAVTDPSAARQESASGSEGSSSPQTSDNSSKNSTNEESNDVLKLLDSFSDAYVWIEIKGNLPERLKAYEAIPLDDWLSWMVYYSISRATAQDLISELGTRDKVSITYTNENGDYAIVFYSSVE